MKPTYAVPPEALFAPRNRGLTSRYSVSYRPCNTGSPARAADSNDDSNDGNQSLPRTHDNIQLRSDLISRTGRPLRLKSGRSRIEAAASRLLPILLPSGWTTLVPGGQLWNVGPAHRPQWKVLDDVPQPTDQKVRGMRVELWVSSPEPAVGVSTPAGTCPGRLRRHT
jgi:hypothetical protein